MTNERLEFYQTNDKKGHHILTSPLPSKTQVAILGTNNELLYRNNGGFGMDMSYVMMIPPTPSIKAAPGMVQLPFIYVSKSETGVATSMLYTPSRFPCLP
jgi:hypothetical protein